MMVNWAEVHNDLLYSIGRRLTFFEDFVAFGGVCVSWRLVMTSLKKNFNTLPQVPWLMLAEKENDSKNFRDLYSPTKCKILRLMLPEASGKRLFSTKGWLLTITVDNEVNLLHPLLRLQIELPNLTTFSNLETTATDDLDKLYYIYIQKIVLSSSPSIDSNYVAMVIYGSTARLAFHKKGENAWTLVETWFSAYSDINYFEGQFYAVDFLGHVVVFDVNGPSPTIGRIVSVMPDGLIDFVEMFYLVESFGRLLIVLREGVFDGTYKFRVFEFNWKEVHNLGNNTALFLGYNSSFSVDVLPAGCKANCIYFTDDCFEHYHPPDYCKGGKDMGIYNLLDGSIEPHFKGTSLCSLSPPLCVTPTFE